MVEYLVVGSGLSGVVIANRIANILKKKVLVIDRRNHIGGNVFDYKELNSDITVQKYGPHIFHTNNKIVWDYLSQYTKWNYYFFKPNVVIDGNYINSPFNLNSLYKIFPLNLAEKIEKQLITTYGYGNKVDIKTCMQSQDELILFIANFVYEKIFKNYTTKQWGIDFKEIDEETISRVKIKISHDDRYFEDKYQGIPLKGYSSMIENILDNKNIEILLNTDFKDINNDYKMVFYTGSIDEFYDYKYGILPYRSLEFDIQIRDEEYYQNTSMTNYPNNYDFTRITEHKYFLNEKSSHTVISLEYPKEFDINKNERFYPIKTNKNIELYNKYYELYKKDKNVIILGRLGTYRYINMDETIFQALEIFRNFKD